MAAATIQRVGVRTASLRVQTGSSEAGADGTGFCRGFLGAGGEGGVAVGLQPYILGLLHQQQAGGEEGDGPYQQSQDDPGVAPSRWRR